MNFLAFLISTFAVGQCYPATTVVYDYPVYSPPAYVAPITVPSTTYIAPTEHHNLINTGTIRTKCYERVRIVAGGRTYYREVPVVNGWLPSMTEHKDSSGRVVRIDFDYSERISYAQMKPKGITYRDSNYTPPKPRPAPKPTVRLSDLPEPLTYPSTPSRKVEAPPLVKIDRGLSSTLSDDSATIPSDSEFRRLKWDVDSLNRSVRTLERNQRTQQQDISDVKTDISGIRRMLKELIELIELIDRENRKPPTDLPEPAAPTPKSQPLESTLQEAVPGHQPMKYPDIEGSLVAPDNEIIQPKVE